MCVRKKAPGRIICLQFVRADGQFFMMLFNTQWRGETKTGCAVVVGQDGGRGGGCLEPQTSWLQRPSLGYALVCLRAETGVNLSCDLCSALCATLTWR